MHNHTKRRKCPIKDCRYRGAAEYKDIYRHLWAHHENYAREHGVKRDLDRCEVCDYYGRRDNVKRHKRLQHGIGVA